jgi:hypothetical protein
MQAAEELAQWKTLHEERKIIDASPAAMTLALALSPAELDDLAAKLEKSEQAA